MSRMAWIQSHLGSDALSSQSPQTKTPAVPAAANKWIKAHSGSDALDADGYDYNDLVEYYTSSGQSKEDEKEETNPNMFSMKLPSTAPSGAEVVKSGGRVLDIAIGDDDTGYTVPATQVIKGKKSGGVPPGAKSYYFDPEFDNSSESNQPVSSAGNQGTVTNTEATNHDDSSFLDDLKHFGEDVWNGGVGYTIARFLGYSKPPGPKATQIIKGDVGAMPAGAKPYHAMPDVLTPEGYTSKHISISEGALEGLGDLGAPITSTPEDDIDNKKKAFETTIYMPTPETLAKKAAAGVVMGFFAPIDIPIIVTHSAVDKNYRQQVIQGLEEAPARAAMDPFSSVAEGAGMLVGGGASGFIIDRMPVKPKVTMADLGNAKVVSMGIMRQKGEFTSYTPIVSVGKGIERFISRNPRLKNLDLLPEEGITPKSAFEADIIAKSLPEESTKITAARTVREITSSNKVAPSQVRGTIEDVLKEHGLPEELVDDIIAGFKKHRATLYGSAVQKAAESDVGTVTLLRTPRDFDVAVKSPEQFAKEMTEAINKRVGRRVATVEPHGSGVLVSLENGEKIFDIHSTGTRGYGLGDSYIAYGLREGKTYTTEEGVNVIGLSEQASRKLSGSMVVRPKKTEVGEVEGFIAPTHAGRVKDIADYYILEKSMIDFMKRNGKVKKASIAEQNLEKWLDAWGPDIAKMVKSKYSKALTEGVEIPVALKFANEDYYPSMFKGGAPSFLVNPARVSEVTRAPASGSSLFSTTTNEKLELGSISGGWYNIPEKPGLYGEFSNFGGSSGNSGSRKGRSSSSVFDSSAIPSGGSGGSKGGSGERSGSGGSTGGNSGGSKEPGHSGGGGSSGGEGSGGGSGGSIIYFPSPPKITPPKPSPLRSMSSKPSTPRPTPEPFLRPPRPKKHKKVVIDFMDNFFWKSKRRLNKNKIFSFDLTKSKNPFVVPKKKGEKKNGVLP